jgi:hypothetical protein
VNRWEKPLGISARPRKKMTTTWRNWLIKNKKGLEITLSENRIQPELPVNRMNDSGDYSPLSLI